MFKHASSEDSFGNSQDPSTRNRSINHNAVTEFSISQHINIQAKVNKSSPSLTSVGNMFRHSVQAVLLIWRLYKVYTARTVLYKPCLCSTEYIAWIVDTDSMFNYLTTGCITKLKQPRLTRIIKREVRFTVKKLSVIQYLEFWEKINQIKSTSNAGIHNELRSTFQL